MFLIQINFRVLQYLKKSLDVIWFQKFQQGFGIISIKYQHI